VGGKSHAELYSYLAYPCEIKGVWKEFPEKEGYLKSTVLMKT